MAGKNCSKVDPIKDLKQLNLLKRYLYEKNIRDYALFVIGINTGLRIGDLLNLTIESVKDKDFVTIIEQKSDDKFTFQLNQACKDAINEYLLRTGLGSGFLFPGKKPNRSLTKEHAYFILSNAAKCVGITEHIGTHSMRKTFAYHNFREGGVNYETVGKWLNHSPNSGETTNRYVCNEITQDELNEKVYLKMNL